MGLDAHDRAVGRDISKFVIAASAALVAIAILIFVIWLAFSTVKATGFDADGVRCYAKAMEMACLKTANP